VNVLLDEPTWQARRAAHERRVDAWIGPHLERARRSEAHPVEDFLFTYYSHRPARLRRWHPGWGTTLQGPAAAHEFLTRKGYVETPDGVTLDHAYAVERKDSIRWTHDLLEATLGRPANFGCFGLHEWAMVYRRPAEEVRHNAWPLRLGPAGTDDVVEQHRVRCSHFDAFRFFTVDARPRNTLQPSRETQTDLEQGGCLHANMDIYKWAYKLAPLVPAELVADGFELARSIRTLDMRASPYDLSALGYPPVRIETADGKAEYTRQQRAFADRASELRQRLLTHCDQLLEAL
jgi:hypothetical protein